MKDIVEATALVGDHVRLRVEDGVEAEYEMKSGWH